MRMSYSEYAKRLRADGVDVEYIRTYSDYKAAVRHFKRGKVRSQIIIGPSGIGKSWFYEKTVAKENYIRTRLSAAMLYEHALQHVDEPIVIDDVDGMLGDRMLVSLLKALLERRDGRVVTWFAQNTHFKQQAIDKTFNTSSPIAILLNCVPDKPNSDLIACLKRSSVIIFDPPNSEIHKYVGTWFRTTYGSDHIDVYKFVGDNLHLATNLTCRTYDLLIERKKCGGDFEKYALNMWSAPDQLNRTETRRSKMLALIGALTVEFKNPKDRVAAFVKRTKYKPNAYFHWLREWKKLQGLDEGEGTTPAPIRPPKKPKPTGTSTKGKVSPIQLPPPPKPGHDRTFD